MTGRPGSAPRLVAVILVLVVLGLGLALLGAATDPTSNPVPGTTTSITTTTTGGGPWAG